jgi:hypothetical protein
MNILKEGYFYYKEYKLLIKNAKVEPRILNSLYRADVFGELLCGTPCIIEVIKTSKVSEVKKEFINKLYYLLFNEEFNFNCQSCVNVQVRRLKNYLNDKLNIKVT